jgi:nucleoid-associated protein YgaU
MAGFPPISVRQPRPFDLVDDPVAVSGVGTGFEGVFAARVRDGNGNQLMQVTINAGGTGVWANYHTTLALGGIPATPQGTLEVFESSAKDGSDINKVIVPITFGVALINPYNGFTQDTVQTGDTLSGMAQKWYGNPNLFPRIFEANRDQIVNPNLIFPGQVLRIPQ